MSSRSTQSSRFAAQPLAFLVTAFLLTAALPAAAAEEWLPGPNMSVGRRYFALVDLPSGDLLAPGGDSPGLLYTNRADIFSVAGRSFSETTAMPDSHRYQKQAVLLGNGKVLIAGEQVDGVVKESLLFREATHSWPATVNDPAVNRFAAAMILLPGGKVLYAGGYDGHADGSTYNSAELFDPVLSTWSSTGSMVALRAGHTLTLLATGPNAGKVLVTGGGQRIGLTVEARCELYDPVTGTFALTGPLNLGRIFHTATRLLDGRVLVTGGSVAGQVGNNHDTVEIYDPATGTWSFAASMATRRGRHTATLLPNGDVLVVGGVQVGSMESVTASAEIYHPAANSWRTVTPSMSTARVGHAAALLPSGEVLVAGGYDGTSYLATSEIYHDLSDPRAAADYYTLTPCRLLDTRQTAGASGGPALASGTERTFPVSGVCGVPADATAVAVNVTVVQPAAAGYLQLYPIGGAVQATSTLNFTGGQVRANNALLTLGPGGQATALANLAGPGTADLVVDVMGYFRR